MEALDTHRERHGWGFVSVRKRFDGDGGGVSAATYLGKYVSKAVGVELAVRRPVYIGSPWTQAVGLTMRLLRWRRYIWRRWGFRPGADELRPLVQLLQAFPNLEYVGTSVQPSGP